jgi:hypothetical protein
MYIRDERDAIRNKDNEEDHAVAPIVNLAALPARIETTITYIKCCAMLCIVNAK